MTTVCTLGPEDAQRLIDDGFYQVSRKFRLLAKLPTGKDGIQALIEGETEAYKRTGGTPRADLEIWAKRIGPVQAADHYLSCHAPTIEVSRETFDAFRKLGGNTYRAIHWNDPVLTDFVLKERIEKLAAELEYEDSLGLSEGSLVSARYIARRLREALDQGV